MLTCPEGMVDMVLDTDTYNEIDDQFALSYALFAEERLQLKAVYAAPFFNERSTGPADGMERSYQEILKLFRLAGKEVPAFRGTPGYLQDEKTPWDSPAARDLCDRAMQYTWEKPLYVVCLGAITNVASALLLQPDIADRIGVPLAVQQSQHPVACQLFFLIIKDFSLFNQRFKLHFFCFLISFLK